MINNIVLILFLTASIIYLFEIGNGFNEHLENFVYLISSGLAVIGAYLASKTYGFKNHHGQALMLMALGFAFWFIGDFLWGIFKLFLKIDPYPSAADLFYLLGYPFICSGLIKEINIANIKFNRANQLIIFLVGLLSLYFLGAVIYFGIILSYNPEANLLENIIAISYGLGDLLLVIPSLLVLILAWEYKGGKIFKPWIYIFLGLVIILKADLLYAMFQTQYESELWPFKNIDLVYISGYLTLSVGLFKISNLIKDVQKKLS